MMCDPEYMETFDAMTLDDDCDGSANPDSSSDASSDDEPPSTLEQARLEWRSQVQQQPEDGPKRAEIGETTDTENKPPNLGSSEVPPASEVVTDDNLEELLEPPALGMLKDWAKKMFNDPEGKVADLPMLDRVYEETNGLIVNAKQAIFELFGMKAFKAALCCSPERGDLKLSQEEALGWLLAHARGRRLLELEARPIGKYAGTQAAAAKKALDCIRDAAKVARCKARKKDASAEALAALDAKAAQDRAKITEAPFPLKHMPAANTVIVERRAPKPKPAAPAPLVDYSGAGDTTVPLFSAKRHPEIKGCRGRPGGGGGDPDERYWNPAKPPCVPSDDRPEHLFNTRVAAEAASTASQVEASAPPPPEDEYGYFDAEHYELACLKHQHALRRLREAFPEVDPCPLVRASLHETRPCPCGRGVLARWPWVAQTAQLGFCACDMASWELTCWRYEWLALVGRDLPL